MPNIALIVAMRSEVPHALRKTNGTYQVGQNAISLIISGVGLKRASKAAQRVCCGSLGFHSDFLIHTGFCGAVGKGLDVGHLVIAGRLAHREREIHLCHSSVEKVAGLLKETEYHIGKLQSFNWPVLARSWVPRDTLAVDMESFAIAQTAAKHRIPLVVIKAVSDIVPEQISLTGLLRLARSLKINTQKAGNRLNKILEKIFVAPDLFN